MSDHEQLSTVNQSIEDHNREALGSLLECGEFWIEIVKKLAPRLSRKALVQCIHLTIDEYIRDEENNPLRTEDSIEFADTIAREFLHV